MKDYNQLIYTRVDKSFNIVILIASIISFLGAIFLYVAGSQMIYALLNFIISIILFILFIMAKKLKTTYKIVIMIIATSIIAIASYVGGSFASAFITLLLLANIIAILFLELKTSIMISFLFTILMIGLGFYSIVVDGLTGIINPFITWALQIIAYVLFIVTVHISIYVIKNYLIENIEDLEAAMIETNQLAYYDQLTKLPNVYKFKQEVEAMIAKHQRDGFILLFSLKSLNLINSTLGYQVGNQTLIELTNLFKSIVGNQGIVAKTGGNEFAIWIDQLTKEDCFITFSKVLDDLKDRDNILKKKLEFHSVFTRFIYGQETFDDCYQKGILTLTYAKNNDIHHLLLYNDELASHFTRKEMIKDLLEKAITHDEITLHYQAKFDVRKKQIIGLEGLARWNSPELGAVAPNEFIPIIEATNLSTRFGNFIIDHVCKDFKKLKEKYHEDICVSLNISPSHIIDPSIIESLKNSLEKYHIPPDRITLEITEDIIIEGIDVVKPILIALREMKLKISLDDFGTGYSSLNYLSQLEIDELKIDKTFVNQIKGNNRISILIDSIIRLSKQLQLTVIAEGVETKEQSDVLNELGCYVIQGYYYSKPEEL